jgi:CDP-diacylglycerol--glycerol-3-phosphate 3-phosphatidyltransferase
MNLPNTLTAARILLVPVLMVFLLSSFRGHDAVALAVFLLATLTDTVDGVLARRTDKTTELGALLDPIADKLLITAAFICLVGAGRVPAWMAAVIVGREIAVTGFRAIAAARGIVIPAGWIGKVKMNLEIFAIAFFILGRGILGKVFVAGQIILWLAMIVAVASAAEYFRAYGPGLVRGDKAPPIK